MITAAYLLLVYIVFITLGINGETSQLEEHAVDHERIINKLFYHLFSISPDDIFKHTEFESVMEMSDTWQLIGQLRKSEVIILPSYALGLANRLRTISSVSVIANELNRTLIVLWIRSYECNANSEDLFSLVDPSTSTSNINSTSSTDHGGVGFSTTVMIDVAASIGNAEEGWLELYPSQELISHYVGRLVTLRNDVIAYYQSLIALLEESAEPLDAIAPAVQTGIGILQAWSPLTAVFRKPPAFDIQLRDWQHPADIMVVWTLTTHQFSDTDTDSEEEGPRSHNVQRRDAFFRFLVPSPAVNTLLDKYRVKFEGTRGEHLVGVHLRAFHSFYDWNMVTPVVRTHQWGRAMPDISSCSEDILAEYNQRDDQQSVALRFDESASMEDFVATMRKLIAKNATILLISNSNEMKHAILRKFNKAGGIKHVVALVDGDFVDDNVPSADECASSSSGLGECLHDLAATKSRSAERSSIFGMQLAMADLFAVSGYLHLHLSGTDTDTGTGTGTNTGRWVSPTFLVPELIIHTKGSSLAAEASVRHDIPLAAIVTTVHPPPSNARQVSFILSVTDSLRQTLSAMDMDMDMGVSEVTGSGSGRSLERIRAEYVAVCGSGGGTEETDPVRRNMSPRLRSRCDAMKACYVESADRCLCTLLLKYSPCPTGDYMPLVLARMSKQNEMDIHINTGTDTVSWLVAFLFGMESSMYCLDDDYHNLRRIQADTHRPRVRGHGGDLLWVYAETTGQGL